MSAAGVRLATGPVSWGVDFAHEPTSPDWRFVLDQIAASGSLTDRVTHASFDLAPHQLAAIQAGTLAFTVDSQQYLQGYLGVALLHLHATGGVRLAGEC